jgi:hypothetical protein
VGAIACSRWCHSWALVVGWSTSAICLHDLVLFVVVALAASTVCAIFVWFGDVGKLGICVAVRTIPMRCAPVISLNLTRVPGADVTLGMMTAKGAVGSSACQPRWANPEPS